MTETSMRRERVGLLGIAAVACVACCAGPLLALLGGLIIAGLASGVLVGALGFAVAIIAGVGCVAVRRRRRAGIATAMSVMVAPPARKTPVR